MGSDQLDMEAIADWTPRRVDGETDRAAILIPVVERSETPALLFTKRADHLGEHPGQMSFPGGGRELRDTDLEATALRECHEEIGLRSEEVSLVGRLDDIQTITDYAVTPFVGRIPDRPYEPDHTEVAEVVTLPLEGLLEPTNYEAETRSHPHVGEVTVPYFHTEGYTVWGATARILIQFLKLSLGWAPPASPE
jgi:8-oxo-dGTP pyrophosphatase MutT (NUDIX family)